MSVVICVVACLITWPVLFPIYATGKGTSTQLNILTFGNVANPYKYFATIGCMYLVFFFVFAVITREMIYYVNLRQAYLMNPGYAHKLPSRTVLYTAVPAEYLNAAKIRTMLGPEVKNVWFPTDTKQLQKIVDERQDAAMTLEGAETKLIMAANGERLKAHTKGAVNDAESAQTGAEKWITPKMRPTHKLGFLGLFGKKVDSINWGREEVARLTPLVEEEQAKHRSGNAKLSGAVFVEFATLGAAQSAYQSLTHHQMLKMSPRFTGMNPAEVIWGNLKIKGWERFIRSWVTSAIVIALIIFWSIPVAFIGVISNINYWIGPGGKTPWLGFLNKIPTVIFGVITGLLPVILLAVLMALLPIFLRWMAKLSGSPTLADVEYKVSNYYFGFQVVQVFLVTTFSAAVSGSVFSIIKNPSQAPTLLAEGLPTSNGFYLSYIVLQGLGVVAGLLAGIVGLFLTPLLIKFLGSTPRKIFGFSAGLNLISYGTVYPIYLNLLVIGKFCAKVSVITDLFSHQLLLHCSFGDRVCSHWSLLFLLCLQVQHHVCLRHWPRYQGFALCSRHVPTVCRSLHCRHLHDWPLCHQHGQGRQSCSRPSHSRRHFACHHSSLPTRAEIRNGTSACWSSQES
jgi:hypothetical protein